ncbi:unnamed protein product [Echinostoma caproni]|uniref:Uncharacterized protein n=1 Tax=Echinostoma caproni TaxID=27848 RepID=A0A183B8T7_9TREM|nr:unnamed protein product [Echinostoma caproni]
MSAIRDIILKPPEDNVYDVLKAAILQVHTLSNEERLRQLLDRHPIGDTMLSKHLARLRTLAGPANAHSDIVRRLLLESLPHHAQPTVMALLEDASIDKAASIADKMVVRVGSENNFLVATTSQPYKRNRGRYAVGPSEPRPHCLQHRSSFKDRVPVPTANPCRAKPRLERVAWSAHVSQKQSNQKPSQRKPPKAPDDPNCWFHRGYGYR